MKQIGRIKRMGRIKALRVARKRDIAFAMSLIVIASMIPRPAHAQGILTGWVGVAYTTSIGQPDRDGMLVFTHYPVIESIEPNSPAERAGLEAGDTILAMNAQDLKRRPLPMAAMIQPGQRVVFRYKRDGVVRDAIVTVAQRPRGASARTVITMYEPRAMPAPSVPREPGMTRRERASTEVAARAPTPPMAALPPMAFGFGPRSIAIAGAEVTALNAGLRSLVGLSVPGIFVVNVALGTPAKESGLEPADVITKAEGSPVGDPGDLIRALRESKESSIRLQIVRKKKAQTITLRW